MSQNDITLSFTSQIIADFAGSGIAGAQHGPVALSQFAITNFLNTDNHSPVALSDVGINILNLDNHGTTVTVGIVFDDANRGSAVTFSQPTGTFDALDVVGNLIQYEEISSLSSDEIRFTKSMELTVFPGTSVMASGLSRNLIDIAGDTTLDISQSNSVVINTTQASDVNITLPVCEVGARFKFKNFNTGAMILTAVSGDKFSHNSDVQAQVVAVTGVAGSEIEFISTENRTWLSIGNESGIVNTQLLPTISPATISGSFDVWLDASDTSTLAVTPGVGSVTEWRSKITTKSRPFIPGNAPSIVSGVINNLDSVLFNFDNSEYLTSNFVLPSLYSDPLSTSPYTVISIVQATGVLAQNHTVWSIADTTTDNEYHRCYIPVDNDGVYNTRIIIDTAGAGVPLINGRSNRSLQINIPSVVVHINPSGYGLLAEIDGDEQQYKDRTTGLALNPAIQSITGQVDPQSFDNIALGALERASVSNYYGGYLCEYIIATGILDSETKKQLITGLMYKWGGRLA